MPTNPKRTTRTVPVLALSLAAVLTLTLGGCARKRTGTPDDAPTLKSLASRSIVVVPDAGQTGSEDKAIAAYRKFLDVAPRAPQRAEAMRRLGDLEMDVAENRFATSEASTPAADYGAAIARYQEFLKSYPQDPGNDRVLYQLGRAYEQGGQLEIALKTLDQLVHDYPDTRYRDEAHFRRGELLFALRDYVHAEQAFAAVLQSPGSNSYQERSLYMQGWSQFKQGRFEDALNPFFGVFDRKLAALEGTGELDTLPGLTRADRELLEDTFRVASLCLQNLAGADSIEPYIRSEVRRTYEFRVYQQLGELYLRQDRSKDAADTFGAFARKHPLHAQAPQLQARVVDIYQSAGLASLALAAKKDYVSRYGASSEFRRANPTGWALAQPLVKTHLEELARYHHAAAQKSKATADYQQAVHWYRTYLESFPADPQAAHNNFLLAELLFEDGQFTPAAAEYEKTAYAYPVHAQSADAGYAALLAYAQLEATLEKQATHVDSALRFAKTFPQDARSSAVLTDAAEKLYARKDAERAASVAQQVLDLTPPAPATQRRTAWTVLAHIALERGAFADAEHAYTEVLALAPANDPARKDLVERLAAAVYQQGEQARAAGQTREAVAHFERVVAVAPLSAVRVTAQYDTAAALISLKDWAGASRTLEDFRQRNPQHALQGEVTVKLALAYTEQGQWAKAAAELERIAATAPDPTVVRSALWQAAELHEKAANQAGGSRVVATRAYERFLKLYPEPLEPALETRYRLAQLANADGNAPRELALMKEIFKADQSPGAARTNRTRYLGATAALALAEPLMAEYRKVALVEPLARQLKQKKARMEEVLRAYGVAADYGVADVTTAATYYTASVYQDFGRAMLGSQRPKKLSKAELEQYNVMLEEQADPFTQKATDLHEVNARRAAQGVYDQWVRSSFKSLGELRPLRYGKVERGDLPVSNPEQAVVQLEKAIAANPQQALPRTQLGIAYRQQGQFAKARQAYEKALELSPRDPQASLNLAILHDLYLSDGPHALEMYERYLTLTPGGDPLVSKWVADLKNRKPAVVLASKKES